MDCICFETVLNDFISKEVVAEIFFFLSKVWNRELIVVIVYYFQIWNKKEYIYMGPMYIETPGFCQ